MTKRKNTNTTINSDLWFRVKLIAWNMSRPNHQTHVNDLIEESIREYILKKYNTYLPDEYKSLNPIVIDEVATTQSE